MYRRPYIVDKVINQFFKSYLNIFQTNQLFSKHLVDNTHLSHLNYILLLKSISLILLKLIIKKKKFKNVYNFYYCHFGVEW